MVNVPPLLCSTPPPIDFGEEDDDSGLQSTLKLEDSEADEYSEYGLVTDTHESSLKVPELPELPISTAEFSGHQQPPDLRNGFDKNIKSTVEAFNYEVKTPPFEFTEESLYLSAKDNDALAPPPFEREVEEALDQNVVAVEEEEDTNTNDNVPSLKLDTLSLYSNESVSPPSTLSPVCDKQATKATTICHQVTVEDVSDDSDEECSPKKPKELIIPEGAVDFFAIEIVETPTQKTPAFSNHISQAKSEDDFVAFQEESKETPSAKPELNGNIAEVEADAQIEDDEFGDFANFAAAPAAVEPVPAETQDDGFDDFQDFVAPTTAEPTQAAVEEDGDDDDFGDFAAPTVVPAPVALPVLPQPPPATATHLSIDERVKPVLELMFPNGESSCIESKKKHLLLAETQSLHFGDIEQAHALSYQWANSEMRHSLVRALAIDSRNILFGDKWNASMPRYAANLSFDPLKPLKPLPAAQVPSSSPQPSNNSWRPTNNSSSLQTPQGIEAANSAAATSQAKAQPSPAFGQDVVNDGSCCTVESTIGVSTTCPDDTTAAASVFAAATTATPLSPALSADGNGHNFDDAEQLAQQQQQFDLRNSPLPSTSPSPPIPALPLPLPLPSTVNSQQLHEILGSSNSISSSSNSSFALPLKETHIYTPSKSDTAVAKTTTLAPIDFDYEIASAGIIIDETVVKKEYRDVEYKPPPYNVDSPSTPSSMGKPTTEDDDFSDFQSVPAVKNIAQLQPPRNGTPTFGEQMILSPAILLPQTIPLSKPTIEWGENAQANINADELARIEELFSHQHKPPTISASVAQQSPKQQKKESSQAQEDDEWSDFVSVPVQQQQQQQQQNKHNNNVLSAQKSRTCTPTSVAVASAAVAAVQKDDEWSDFVSSTPLPARATPQFNSGAWQSANFYNNPLSMYQHQQQMPHSDLVPKYQNKGSSSNNYNNNNNNNSIPQQIHMMHDFSTAPTSASNGLSATYLHQHHQHHQQQLLQQQQQQQKHQRQQFHLSNAKVAPRISLIPDLSFVAPALPANAGAFMNSLPKPSFGAKK